ncbi:DUF433 domain-containing protein [Dyadobacter sp. 22481]|uniref:DUF433 domain-containing protein n=1 Tax=Dyadobacter sp. 22481 TaxID=3453926 RepID=UPI003F858282
MLICYYNVVTFFKMERKKNMGINEIVTIDPEILSGQPVFSGTRVPIDSLFDHLEAGVSLDDFLDDFPSVTRDQAVALLEAANKLLSSKHIEQLYEAVTGSKFAQKIKAGFPEHKVRTVREMG